MKPYILNTINALTLILIGSWAYLSSETPSVTALIPVFFGIVLILLSKGLKSEKKLPAHLAVVLTVLVLLGLSKPLVAAIGKHNLLAITRVAVMMVTSVLALISFIQSFIAARKK